MDPRSRHRSQFFQKKADYENEDDDDEEDGSLTGKDLDGVVVRVSKEYLPGTVRPLLFWGKSCADTIEMFFPGIEIIDAQSKVVVSVGGSDHLAAAGNQVQFLGGAQAKPGSRKIEGRARKGFEAQDIAVEADALVDVGDVDGNVI